MNGDAPGSRLEQARSLVRSVEIVVEVQNREDIQTRAFVHVDGDEDDADGAYIGIGRIMSDQDSRKLLLARALREAESWQRRYQNIEELAAVYEAIKRVKKKAA